MPLFLLVALRLVKDSGYFVERSNYQVKDLAWHDLTMERKDRITFVFIISCFHQRLYNEPLHAWQRISYRQTMWPFDFEVDSLEKSFFVE